MQMLFEHFPRKKRSLYTCCYLTWANFFSTHLTKNLQHTIEADEIHIIYQLLNAVLLVKCWHKWYFQDQHFGTTRRSCESKSIYILSRKSAPITSTELLDHVYMQLTRGTPWYTLQRQLFNTQTISARYQTIIATNKSLSRTYQLCWRNKTYTSI